MTFDPLDPLGLLSGGASPAPSNRQPGGEQPRSAASGSIADLVRSAAERNGVPPELALRISGAESSNNPSAQNPNSSAGGIFQMIDSTYAALGGPPGKKMDPEINADLGTKYIRQNMESLERDLGRPPTFGEVYAAHFFGAGVGKMLRSADRNAPIEQGIAAFEPPARVRAILEANPQLRGKTVGQALDWLGRKVGDGAAPAGASRLAAATEPAAQSPDPFRPNSPKLTGPGAAAAGGASASDFGREFAASFLSGIGSIGQFIGEAGAAAMNAATGTQDYEGKNLLNPAAEALRDGMSEGGKAAREASQIQGDILRPETWELPTSSAGWGMLLTSGLGSVATSVLPVLPWLSRASAAAKAGNAAGATAASRAAMGVGAGVGGAMTGGAAAEEVRQSAGEFVSSLSHEELMGTVPAYAEAFQRYGDEQQARQATINLAAQSAGLLSAAFGAAGGALNAAVIDDIVRKGVMSQALAKVPGGFAARGAVAGAGGAVAEGGQELTEKVGQNVGEDLALGRDPIENATRNTAGDVIAGAVTGGVLGGVGGVTARAPVLPPDAIPAAQKAQEPNSPLSKAATAGNAAAVEVAGAMPPPEPVVPPPPPADPIMERVRAIKAEVRSSGILDALRAESSPLQARDFINDLAIASSASTPPDRREQALSRLESAMEWAGVNLPEQPAAPGLDEILAPAGGGQLPQGPRPTPPQMREAVDRDAEIQQQRAAATTDFDRGQALEQQQVNLEQRMRAPQAPAQPPAAPAVEPIQPGEQERLEAAALTGQEANRRREDDPRQAVIDRALRNVEERGGVASPAEARIFQEAGIGRPYDRIDETLAPEPSVDDRLTAATGIALERRPRETVRVGQPDEAAQVREEQNARADSRMQRLAADRRTALQRRDEANEQAAARQPARPSLDSVVSALKTIPALRTAEQKAVVDAARRTMSAEQMRLLQDEAVNPANLTATDRLQLRQMREAEGDAQRSETRQPDPTRTPYRLPNLAAKPGAGPAVIRKRKAQFEEAAKNGFETVERREDGFYLRNARTGQEAKLSGAGDAALARAAIKRMVDERAHAAAASPKNDRPEPTPAQIEAGNYKKGDRIPLNGVTVVIENPAGSIRRSKPGAAVEWETKMRHHYGDILGTKGADGDGVDVFIGPNPASPRIFIVDQVNRDGTFDEHKVLFGFDSEQAAREGYLSNYDKGWTGLGAITELTQEQFKAWVKDREATTEPAARPEDVATEVEPDTAPGTTFTVPVDGQRVTLTRVDTSSLGEDSPSRDGKTMKVGKKTAALISAMAQALGKRVQFYSDPTDSVGDGFVMPGDPDTIYLRDRTSRNPLAIFGHELMHQVRRENEPAWNAIASVVSARVEDPKGFRKDYYGADEAERRGGGALSPQRGGELEEMVSDLGGDLMTDPTFWSDVFAKIEADSGKDAKGIIARLIAQLQAMVDLVVGAVKGPRFQAARFVRDMESIRAAYRDGMAEYLKGSKITKAALQAEILRSSQRDMFASDFATKRSTVQTGRIVSSRGDTAAGGNVNSAGRQVSSTKQGLQNFWRWFGDSEAVDDSGRPLVLYHSTNSDVRVPRAGQRSTNNYGFLGDVEVTRSAVFVTPDIGFSQEYLRDGDGQNVMPVYAKIENPLDLREGLSVSDEAALEGAGLSARYVRGVQNYWELLDNDDAGGNEFVDGLKRLGYDGLIFREDSPGGESAGGTTYAVFEPSQLKSAIGNRGTFDPADGDITRSPARGIHFSQEPRTTLDGAYYGRGLKGAERERVMESTDPRIKRRVYFYVDEGQGVRPEAGVGGYAHEIELPKLYDVRANAEKLWSGGDLNGSESRLLDAGYGGYWIKNHETGQGIGVVLGNASRAMAAKVIPTPFIQTPAAPKPTSQTKGLMANEIGQVNIQAIPGARLRFGNLTVPPESYDAANAEMERIGSPIRFGDEVVASKSREPLTRVHDFEVSTREPSARPTKGFAPEDSRANLLISDFASGLGQSKWLSAVTELVEAYPNYRAAATATTPEKKLERLVRQMVENLVWLHDQVPAGTRSRSKLWYDGAKAIAERWTKKYGITDAQAAGILAVLSPQKDWFMNVSLANRVADIMTERQAFRWSKQMDETAARIFGKDAYQEDIDAIRGQTLQDLDDPYLRAMWLRVYDQAHNPSSFYIVSPEGDFVAEARTKDGTLGRVAWGGNSTIAKAVSIFENGSFENISAQLGRKHKVRNFYNNILVPNSPNGHVTIDTHAVAAALLRPLSGFSTEVMHNFGGPKSAHAGLEGTYALYEEAYRRAAEERGVLPREMQSITWEAVRGLFVPTFKAQKRNVDAIDAVWTQFQKGRLSYERARQQVLDLAGGIAAPGWAGRDPGAYAEDEQTVEPGDLPEDGVPAGGAAADGGGSGRRAGAAAVRSSTRGDRGGRDEGRGLAPLPGAPSVQGASGPDPRLVEVAERYASANGIDLRRQAEYVKVDPERASRIAAAYDAMPHAPSDPKVKAAYEDLIRQTRAQYDALVDAGYKAWFMDPDADPYGGNPWNAMRDLRANQSMAVFPTEAGFGSSDLDVSNNPLLADTGITWPYGSPDGEPKRVLANDLFRFVHDAFGHGLEGAGFRADGEENAWQAHVRLFTGPAVGAITSETRGQNSWLNYGPYGEKNRTAKVEDTVFADQKTGLMPEWTWTEGRAADEPARSTTRDITDTEAFKRWFGNSVMTETGQPGGKPARLYHGGFPLMDAPPGKGVPKPSSRGSLGYGFYMTPDPTRAQRYAIESEGWGRPDGKVTALYARLLNPLVIEHDDKQDPVITGLVAAGVPRDKAIKKVEKANEEHGWTGKELMSAATKAGHDGVVFVRDGVLSEVVVYQPTQVKSADGNDGSFSWSPDIRRSARRDVTETQEFKAWFGDSKVVDDQGRPKVVYHATHSDFSEFARTSDVGFHFAANPEPANIRLKKAASERKLRGNARVVGANLMPAYLRIENPLHIKRDPADWSVQRLGPQLVDAGVMTQLELDELAAAKRDMWTNALKTQTVDGQAWADAKKWAVTQMRDAIIRAGHDGVTYVNLYEGVGSGKRARAADPDTNMTWVAFEPTQIKSAIGNIGAFATDNPDITRSRAREVSSTPEFKRWFKGSIVTNDDGSPMIMYHGGQRDLEGGAFDRTRSTRWRRPSMDTVGSWFSNNPGEGGAESYSGTFPGSVIYPVFLSIKRPKVYDNFRDFLREMHDAAGRKMPETAPGLGSTEELREKLKAQGYDGIAFTPTNNQELIDEIDELRDAVRRTQREEYEAPKSERATYAAKRKRLEERMAMLQAELDAFGGSTEFDRQVVFVAFEPTQIKSIFNDGGFNPDDPNISRSRRRAAWTGDRIDRLIDAHAYTMNDAKTKAYAGWVSPEKFLAATTPADEVGRLESEKRPLDQKRLAEEGQPITIFGSLNDKTWAIDGHEGRHRMMALRDAGVDSVPVVFQMSRGVEADVETGVFVPPQRWGDTRAQGGFLVGLTPISYKFKDEIKRKFGGAFEDDVLFSRSRDVTQTPEFKKWFGDSKVVDESGGPLVVYHGTASDFGNFRPGSYFTRNPGQAADYAASQAEVSGSSRTLPVYLSIQNPAVVDDDYIEWAGGDEAERAKLSALGYDGMLNKAMTEIVAFRPEQIKSAIGNDGTFDLDDPSIISSRERQTDTSEFKAWSGDAKLVKIGDAIAQATFKSGQPVVVEALHGTTHDITAFDGSKADIESDWGGGFYASNTPSDVMRNYASEDGPDLKNRIELLAERTVDDEFDGDMDAAREAARARLSGGAPNTMKLYIRFRNPAVVGGSNETVLEFEEQYDEEADSYSEPAGKLIEFVEALDWIAPDFKASRGDIQRARDAILGKAYDSGEGAAISDIQEAIVEHLVDAATDDGQSAASEIIRLALKEIGFDGIIDTSVGEKFNMDGMRPDTVHFIAFEPTQLKSAIGNDGSFDDNDPSILSSAVRSWGGGNYVEVEVDGKKTVVTDTRPKGGPFVVPGASKFDDMVYKMQNRQVDLLRVQQAIQETGKQIGEDLNTYLREELFHGRAAKRTQDFTKKELEPLAEEMAKRGLQIEELDEYLHARHAPTANEIVAKRNPDNPDLQDGGSGMTNQQAADYMASLPADKREHLQAIAGMVDKIIADTRKLMVEYELESKETVDGWAKLFKDYVPLMREDDGDVTSQLGTGQGFSIKGREVKSRTGSTKKVVDIFANIAMQRERVIVRGEKNRVAQSLVQLARENPNKDFWTVDLTPTKPTYDEAKGVVVQRPDPMFKMRPNAVVAKFREADGSVKEHVVLFNEGDARAMRTAAVMKNLEMDRLEGLLGASAVVTRYFAAINTQWNPVFGVVNFIRDFQNVLINLKSTPLDGKQKQIAKDAWATTKAIYTNLRTGKTDTEMQKLWDEFQMVGGQTGFRQMFADSQERADDIRATINPDYWMDSKVGKVFTANGVLKVPVSKAAKAVKGAFQWLTDYNDTLENSMRLAVYKAGKESGLSKEEAASIAKNISVNFNRKGQVAQQAGALYAFFNAASQGTARLGQLLFTMEPGKPRTLRLSRLGKRIVAGGVLIGVAQALALAAAGYSEDDPPQFLRERSLIIPTGDTYISIPMPLGLHVLPNLGRVATEWAMGGFQKTPERVVGMLGLLADAFNPIGNAGMSMQTLAPTALDPLVALTENKDWQGRPIAKESRNEAIPGHALARDVATPLSIAISKGINTLTGGNDYVAGAISPTPDQIDYLAGQIGGGVWREFSKIQQTATSVVTGEELPSYKIPLFGRFGGSTASQASEGANFYGNVKRLNELETEIKGLRDDGKMAEAQALRASRPDAYLIAQANRAERDIQKLRKQKSELVKAGAPREQVRAIEERITARMAALNRAVEAVSQREAATQ